MKKSTITTQFPCKFCNKSYEHYTSLSRHKRDYHPSIQQRKKRPVVENMHTKMKRASFPHKCTSCPKAYRHQTSLSRHKRDYHPKEIRPRLYPGPTNVNSEESRGSASTDAADVANVPAPEASAEDILRQELIQLAEPDAKIKEEEGVVMWMVKEESTGNNEYWNLILSSEDNSFTAEISIGN